MERDRKETEGAMDRTADQSLIDQAIGWHHHIAQDCDPDWDGFVAWLEADPRHNAAYEEVADAEFELDGLYRLAESTPATLVRRRTLWRAPLIAASVAAALLGGVMVAQQQGRTQEIATRPGEMRTLALADGTRIVMNGATRIVINERDRRGAELLAGEAKFSVRHDSAHPFALKLGNQQIVDVGTVFNVFRSDRQTRVEVAEGSVRFAEGETRLRLDAGDTLVSSGDGIVEGSMPVEAIASWTRGTLVYRAAPLIDVIGDLSRNRGIAIELGPELSNRRFTGVIQLAGSDDELRARVGQLLGANVAKTPDGWTITR
jgi:transmembrane sensor